MKSRKKIFITEGQLNKLLLIKEGINNQDKYRWNYNRWRVSGSGNFITLKDNRQSNATNVLNGKPYGSFMEAKYEFEQNENSETFHNYVSSAKILLNSWKGIINAVTVKAEDRKITSILEPSAEFGYADDYFGMMCRFYYCPEVLEMAYYYDEFKAEKQLIVNMNAAITRCTLNHPEFKELYPEERPKVMQMIRNLNSGGEPTTIPTKAEIEKKHLNEIPKNNLNNTTVDLDI